MTFLTPLPKVQDCSLLCQCLVILLVVSGWLCCWALHLSINKMVPEFLEHTRLKLVYYACVCVVAAGYFVTRIFHPNVAKNGEICVNTLKKDWKPTLGLRHVLLVQSYPLSGLLYFFEIWQNAYYRPFHAVSDFCLRVVCKKYTTCVPLLCSFFNIHGAFHVWSSDFSAFVIMHMMLGFVLYHVCFSICFSSLALGASHYYG